MDLHGLSAVLDAPLPGPMVDVDRDVPADAESHAMLTRARALIATATVHAAAEPASEIADGLYVSDATDDDVFGNLPAYDPLVIEASRLLLAIIAGGEPLVAATTDIGLLCYRADVRCGSSSALTHLQRAADAGDARAMYTIGHIYTLAAQHDTRHMWNVDTAHWYAKAYTSGHPAAAEAIARMLCIFIRGYWVDHGNNTAPQEYVRLWRRWSTRAIEGPLPPGERVPSPELDALLLWDDAAAALPGTGARPSADLHVANVEYIGLTTPNVLSSGCGTGSTRTTDVAVGLAKRAARNGHAGARVLLAQLVAQYGYRGAPADDDWLMALLEPALYAGRADSAARDVADDIAARTGAVGGCSTTVDVLQRLDAGRATCVLSRLPGAGLGDSLLHLAARWGAIKLVMTADRGLYYRDYFDTLVESRNVAGLLPRDVVQAYGAPPALAAALSATRVERAHTVVLCHARLATAAATDVPATLGHLPMDVLELVLRRVAPATRTPAAVMRAVIRAQLRTLPSDGDSDADDQPAKRARTR